VSYPNYAPPNSPWARVLPDLPAQREPQTPPEQTPPDQLVEASEFSGGAHEATDVESTEVAADPGDAPADDAGVLEAAALVEDLDTGPDPTPEPEPEPEPTAVDAPDAAAPPVEPPPVEPPVAEAPPPVAEAPPSVDAPPVEPVEEAGPLRPGDVSEAPIALWDAAQAAALKERFALVLPLFVDAALRGQHAALDPRATTDTPDTESMRIALRGYRSFLDRILAL